MAEKEIIEIDINASKPLNAMAKLKKELKEIRAAALEAGEGSADFEKLTAKAGELQDQINDVNDAIKSKTGNSVENASRAFSGLFKIGADGFKALAGGAALFGGNAEQVTQTMVQLQAVMAFTDGIKGLAGADGELKNIKSTLSDTYKELNTGFKEGLKNIGPMLKNIGSSMMDMGKSVLEFAKGFVTNFSGMMKSMYTGLKGMFNGLKAMIAANPIGLLLIAATALVAVFASMPNEIEKSIKQLEKVNAELKLALFYNQEDAKDREVELSTEMKLAQINGASQTEILELQIKQNKERKETTKEQLENLKKQQENTREQMRLAEIEGKRTGDYKLYNEQLDKSNALYDEIRAKQREISQLSSEEKINRAEIVAEQKKQAKQLAEESVKKYEEEVEKQKKQREEDLAKYQAYQDKKKAKDQEVLDAQRLLEDTRRAIIKEGQEKEIGDLIIAQDRKLEDLEKAGKLTEELRLAIENETQFKVAEIEKKYADEKASKDAERKNELQRQKDDELKILEDANEEAYQNTRTAEEREITAVQDKYFELIELAKKHGEDTTLLEEEQQRQIAGIRKKYDDEDIAAKKAKQEKITEIAGQAASIITDIGGILANKNKNNEKKAFEINKKASIATAVINTGVAVSKALGSAPPPFNIIAAAAAAISGAKTISDIKATTFEGGSESNSTPTAPNTSSFTAPNVTNLVGNSNNLNTASQAQSVQNGQNQAITINAEIVSTEMSGAQRRDAQIKNMGKL